MSKLYTCTKCGKKKQVFEFRTRSSAKNGIENICKACVSIQSREYYLKNKDDIKRKSKQYREDNADEYRTYSEAYHEANREKLLAYKKEWHEANKDSMQSKARKYYADNRSAFYKRNGTRRARINNACPKWLSKIELAKIKSIYKMANSLTKKTGTKHHVDHIIPLKGDTVCGLHDPSNLRVISVVENLSKSNSFSEDIVSSMPKGIA